MIGVLLAEMLEDMGYSVCSIAATEDNAVADAARCKPGLMIVDQHLLEGNGASAVERILRTGPIAWVFISGTPEYLAKSRVNFLQKPFVEKDLIRAIRYVVGDAKAPVQHESGLTHVVLDH